MAAVTRSLSPDGVPGEDVVAYYQLIGEADVGLLITADTTIARGGLPMTKKCLISILNAH